MRATFGYLLVLCLGPALTIASCGGDDTPIPAMGAHLEFVSPQTQSIRYGGSGELRVQYLDASDNPIAGATIDYLIDGFENGSSLSARGAETGDNGEASVQIRAGAGDANFRVIATPPVGDALEFTIGVSDVEAGSIVVDMTYGGPTAFDSYQASLFDDQTCADLSDPTSLPTSLVAAAPVDDIRDRPAFVNVPAGTGYTVAVVAEMGGTVAGFGCTDAVEVMVARETAVNVSIIDLGTIVRVMGVYDLDNRLDFAGALPGGVEDTVDILAEIADDEDITGMTAGEYGQDPGAFLVDLVMRQTCHWECMSGEDYDTCSEINHPTGDISALYEMDFMSFSTPAEPRFFGGCGAWDTGTNPPYRLLQTLINDQIAMVVPDAFLRFAAIASDIAQSINNAHITSIMNVEPQSDELARVIHELRTMHVTLHDLDGMEVTRDIDLREAGFSEGVPMAEVMVMVNGTAVTIPEHTFPLEYGKLVQFIYTDAVVPLLGYANSAEMLRDWIDCSMVATFLVDNIGFFDQMEYTNLCDTALGAAGVFLDNGLGQFVEGGGTLTLMGTATAGNVDETGLAQTLDAGTWMGMWGEGTESGDITGTFTGTHR